MAQQNRSNEEMILKMEEGTIITLPFFLPTVEPCQIAACCSLSPDDSSLDRFGECQSFDLDTLAWAIQVGLSNSCIEGYLRRWSPSSIETYLSHTVLRGPTDSNFPVLFFAVERNDPELVRLLCCAGANPKQTMERPRLPLLAYCVISAEYKVSDSNDCLSTLLAMGTSPHNIPEDMWYNYIDTPKKSSYTANRVTKSHSWCTGDFHEALCRNFNLLQRYWCKVAFLLPQKTPRQKQIAAAFDLSPLLEIPHQIISQPVAATFVHEWLTSHALHHVQTPLVLLFSGPSGHGKTELAIRMGQLLLVPLLKIDCTQLRHESDFFGARAPYQGWQAGSQLNNFLADHSGKRAVVFLDEFEKTTADVHRSLLLILDEGSCKDRRTNDQKQLDCSKIIWVLASNLGDEIIQKHWNDNQAGKIDYHQLLSNSTDVLQHKLERNFYTKLGAPLTDRLSAIIPFFPFSAEEQAVIAFKFMRKLFNESHKPI